MSVRTRFAPSPTGFLHVGGARTALFNWLFARSAGGQFILRIEDTDVARQVDGAQANITEDLRWLGLDWDEGPDIGGPNRPYVQSQRRELYLQIALRLLESGEAYRCFCPTERLEQVRGEQAAGGMPARYDGRCRSMAPAESSARAASGDPYVIRFRVPSQGDTVVSDFLRGPMVFRNSTLDDFVLVKSDGYPTYHLANVVDDHEMGVTHVLRAEEWIPSTPRHLLLYAALGWEPPMFVHQPLILDSDRTKLSKRSGEMSVQEYRRLGYLPQAMANYLAFLGWTPKVSGEILSLDELVSLFSLERLSRSPSVFDIERLNWFNRQHLKRLSAEELAAKTAPYLCDAYGSPARHEGTSLSADLWLSTLVEAVRDELDCLSDIVDSARFAFDDSSMPDAEAVESLGQRGASEVLQAFADGWARLDAHEYDTADAFFKDLRTQFKTARGLSGKRVMQPIRAALTGTLKGACLVVISILLGKDRCLERVCTALKS